MSVDVKAVPPWKMALLEKKRRHDDDERRRREEEESRLARMPAWKRDIILKKQQQKNSLIFLGKNLPRPEPGTAVEVTIPRGELVDCNLENEQEMFLENSFNSGLGVVIPNSIIVHTPTEQNVILPGPIEEHLVPIQQNPWVRTELERKKYTKGKHIRPSQNSDSSGGNHVPGNSLLNNDSCAEPGVVDQGRDHTDDKVFASNQDGEVEYGRGFVHKLLRKFTHLSSTKESDKQRSLSPKRSHSIDNLLDDHTRNSPRKLSTSATTEFLSKDHESGDVYQIGLYSSPKAHSMENLSGKSYDGIEYEIEDTIEVVAPVTTSKSIGQDISNHVLPEPTKQISPRSPPIYSDIAQDSHPLQRTNNEEKVFKDDMPKRNIVSSTRSIFESVPSTQKSDSKRKAPELPKVSVATSPRDLSPRYETKSLDRKGVVEADGHKEGELGVHNGPVYLNHSLERQPKKPVTEETLQNIRAAGKVWYSTGGSETEGSSPRPSGGDSLNDKNANYTYTADSESRPGTAAVTSGSTTTTSAAGRQAFLYGTHTHNTRSQAHNNKSVSPTSKSAVAQKNQNNNLYNSSPPISNGPQLDVINNTSNSVISPVSPVSPYDSLAKKRPAPSPPIHASSEDSKKHATVGSVGGGPSPDATSNNDTLPQHNRDHAAPLSDISASSVRNEIGVSSGPNRMKLHLDIESKSVGPSQIAQVPSYRELYFNSNAAKKDIHHKSGAVPSYRDLYYSSPKNEPGRLAVSNNTETDEPDVNHGQVSNGKGDQVPSSVYSGGQLDYKDFDETSSTASITSQETGSTISNGWTTSSVASSSSTIESPIKKKPPPPKPSTSRVVSSTLTTKVERPNSIISNNRKPRVKLADLSKVRDSFSSSTDSSSGKEEVKRSDKKSKRPAPSGPGSLLIRPASNLVPGSAINTPQYFKINTYNDVKTGIFEPARKRPSFYDYDDDVPVTNIDDVLSDDIPVTNIDDVSISPRNNEQDADTHRKQASKRYEFVGAGVDCGRSLLKKSKTSNKVRIKTQQPYYMQF